MSETQGVNPKDPVFISYRHSDGFEIATMLAWSLRAAGIPVWRDVDDLPPGDTDARLEQAIDEGISGAVIVVTPDVSNSRVVREVEVPRLLQLHRNSPAFALGIVNAVVLPNGHVDYSAPDRLLELAKPELIGVDQRSADTDGIHWTTRQMLWHRVAAIRPELPGAEGELRISLQTRNTPQVYDRTGADLDIRLRPSTHEKLPSARGMKELGESLRLLPDAVTRAGTTSVRIDGGAHLSVALIVGAGIPSTRAGRMVVVDGRGARWVSTTEAQLFEPPQLLVAREATNAEVTHSGRPEVALYIDLQHPRSDAAFDRFLEAHGDRLVAWKHLTPASDGLLDPEEGGNLAAEAAARMRDLSMSHGNAVVHLIYRGPFGAAILIGRLTNSLRFVAYEWDESDAADGSYTGPRYQAVAMVRASTPTGALEDVMFEDV